MSSGRQLILSQVHLQSSLGCSFRKVDARVFLQSFQAPDQKLIRFVKTFEPVHGQRDGQPSGNCCENRNFQVFGDRNPDRKRLPVAHGDCPVRRQPRQDGFVPVIAHVPDLLPVLDRSGHFLSRDRGFGEQFKKPESRFGVGSGFQQQDLFVRSRADDRRMNFDVLEILFGYDPDFPLEVVEAIQAQPHRKYLAGSQSQRFHSGLIVGFAVKRGIDDRNDPEIRRGRPQTQFVVQSGPPGGDIEPVMNGQPVATIFRNRQPSFRVLVQQR